ncbi:hypothetical protein DQ239_03935 [Blastococcus sp. TF02-09]|uniref:hypothetical protein n=1 Tax=Blastococcus sp. TF02-09 TaxID=2250576 RepID=UPI000DEA290F|nr:hypothetical protein [Blastococcus sp. TF02-9]RBY80231.1 hypothetical protein DQ239_03935 [Blastococcus sp. TF02-9]
MTLPLPDPVLLDPPPGDPHAFAVLGTRLDAAAAFLGDLGEQLAGAPATACGWTGADASAADAQVGRTASLARDAAAAVRDAAARIVRHGQLVADTRRRLAQLREAQTDDYLATVGRVGAATGPTGLPGPGATAAIDELYAAEAERGRLRATLLAEVEDDARATASVLARCSVVAGGGTGEGRSIVVRHLEDLLPGWHAHALGERGAAFAAVLRAGGDPFALEQAARDLLPVAGNGAVAAAVLTGLGAEGLQEVLRLLGDGTLSADSALAGVVAAVLGASVPTGSAAAVAQVRDVRHVDPDDVRTLDADHVALGMGVVLAAARRQGLGGPPVATVREWGRQIIARERALGGEWITAARPQASPGRPGDPLIEVLDRLARPDGGAQAAELLGGEPTWSHLLSRQWEDDGAAFAAVVDRAAAEPGSDGEIAVRSGLRALGIGLADDGDPARWSVDRTTAASIAPALADAVAARPELIAEPMVRAAACDGHADQVVLRGLGYLTTDPAAAAALDRGVADAAARADAAPAAVLAAGYAAVREYGVRLEYALTEFEAQERAQYRAHFVDLVQDALELTKRGEALVPVLSGLAVVADLDGTWDPSVDEGRHVSMEVAVRTAGGSPEAQSAYAGVMGVVGDPTAPVSPPTDWQGLALDSLPGGDRVRALLRRTGDGVGPARDDRWSDIVETGFGEVVEIFEDDDPDSE